VTLSNAMSARSHPPITARLNQTLLAGAALMLCLQAHALTLGRLQVLSAMGEPLRAEVELQDFNPGDATALRLVALPATAYSALGQQNNALASAFEVTLVSGPGAPRLLLSSRQIMDAPFVDFVIEASWPAGRSVREYTALFNDKPAATSPAPSSAVPAVTRPELALSAPQSSSLPSSPANKPPGVADTPTMDTPRRSHVVKAGETAGKIAQTHATQDTTLDQMLLALLRENPQAFTGGNVNQLRAGSVLQIPQAPTAQSVAPSEARQLIQLQHNAFETLRQRIAQTAPSREVPSANRESIGQVTAPVQAAPLSAADKLTLSKGEVSAKDGPGQPKQAPQPAPASDPSADKLAQDLQTRDLESGNRKLSGQLDELQKLSDQAQATAKAAPVPTEPSPITPPDSNNASEAKQPATADPSPPAAHSESAGDVTGSEANIDAQTKPSHGLIDQLIAMPWIPGLAAGLLVALASLGAYRVRQRRKQADAAVSTPEAPEVSAAWQAPVQEDDPSTAPSSPLPNLTLPESAQALMAQLPDLNLPSLDAEDTSPNHDMAAPPAGLEAPEQDLSDDEPTSATAAAITATHMPMSLDLGGLSLDLDVPDLSGDLSDRPSDKASTQEALATKLALAQEFMAMGDKEGARALVDEVLANSSGELRAQAEALLFELA